MKINFKKLFKYLGITLGVGALSAFLTMGSMDIYSQIQKPSLAPPSIVFPIAWSILYILMAISAYIVSESKCENKNTALKSFYIQLAVNFVWPLIFFGLQAFFFSLLWLLFATYLNFSIYLLN